jgi:UDP-N-acetyl-D-glucosamine dehydrogenase
MKKRDKTLVDLEQKIKDKSAKIGIIGLGYVGLPLALAFAEAGFKILGFDIQKRRVDSVNQGRSYIGDVTDERLSSMTAKNLLEATSDQSRLSEVDAICVCVPTPLTKTREPDLSHVSRQSKELSRYLKKGQLIILESTTYPGTTRELVLPTLERCGLKGGQDFYLAYSPERVDPGNKEYSIRNVPKVVGGIDPISTRLALILYQQVAEVVVPVSSPEIAEMTKIFENVFRSVNIALVNELAQLCQRMKISVWEVITTAATKPHGYMPFYPGVGIGGHCIPLDPYYLASKAREYDFHTKFIELAAEINEQMPYYVTARIIEALNTQNKNLNGAEILVLGITYKKDVADVRESPSLKLIQLLREKGARVRYNDPYLPQVQLLNRTLSSIALSPESLSSADCVVIATDHSSYDYQDIADRAKLIFDTRGVTSRFSNQNIVRL